jgi:hypothetical protein
MPLVYNVVASLMVVLELVQILQVWSRGTILGHHNYMQFNMASYKDTILSPQLEADFQLLADWVALGKLIFAISLLGSSLSKDPPTRVFLSVGFTLGLACYFLVMGPQLRKVEELGEFPTGTAGPFEAVFAAIIVAFGIGAFLEVKNYCLVDKAAAAAAAALKEKENKTN